MPCKSGNCQRITSIFSFSSPIFKSILKSACISSTKNNVFVLSVWSDVFSNCPFHVSSRASSMGKDFPLSNFTQIPLAMYLGTKWQKPASLCRKHSWSSWCRSTFTTIAILSFTSPRCGAKTSDKRTIMFSCTNSMPCNLPVRCGFGTVSSWCVNCLSIVLFFLACRWSAACKQNSGTSSFRASLCALSTMLRAMFSQYMPTTWPCLKKSVSSSFLQFSILRVRSCRKWSSDKGAAGVHVRMAVVIFVYVCNDCKVLNVT